MESRTYNGKIYTYEVKQVKSRLTYEEYDLLKKYTEENNISTSDLIRELIAERVKTA